jgi:hypothetical protein
MVVFWMNAAIYCAVGGSTWVIFVIVFGEEWVNNDNLLPIWGSMLWPIGLPILAGYALTRAIVRAVDRRRDLQEELDEARRKRDEQDAADALKEGYR